MSALHALDDLAEEFDGAEIARSADGDGERAQAMLRGTGANSAGDARAISPPLNGHMSPRTIPVPLPRTMTGTRYGAALGGLAAAPLAPAMTGRQWGAGTPKCPRCSKSVYFAEQIKAVGKTWHKACLRCMECGKTLDSGQLVDKDGEPFCRRCYGKVRPPSPALLLAPSGSVHRSCYSEIWTSRERVCLAR